MNSLGLSTSLEHISERFQRSEQNMFEFVEFEYTRKLVGILYNKQALLRKFPKVFHN